MASPDTMAHYLLRSVNKTQRCYGLFEHGDRVLVAVSGGKDSMTLLDLLHRRQAVAPERVSLVAAHIASDYHCGRAVSPAWLAAWCAGHGIPLLVEPAAVAERVAASEHNRCFWCARGRRQVLFETAAREGCSRLALGHHADDVVETTLMNLLYSGRVAAMAVRQPLFDGRITVVRPLALIEERDIAAFARASGYPIEGEPCPDGARSRRAFVRRVLHEAEAEHHGVKRSVFHALRRFETRDSDADAG